MDKIDRKLIKLLQENARYPLKYLAEQVFLSPPAVATRIDKLEKPVFYPFINACPNVIECNCVTGAYSMLIKVAYETTLELDAFIGQLQKFGNTETQIVFSTPVEHRGIEIPLDI